MLPSPAGADVPSVPTANWHSNADITEFDHFWSRRAAKKMICVEQHRVADIIGRAGGR